MRLRALWHITGEVVWVCWSEACVYVEDEFTCVTNLRDYLFCHCYVVVCGMYRRQTMLYCDVFRFV